MQKTDFIILWHSTVHKKNITVLTPENQKRTATFSAKETIRSCTMTARIITLKLSRRTAVKNTEKVKNTGQI